MRNSFADLVRALEEGRRSIGAAESVTAGLFGYLVTREDGAGEVYRGSIVAYQTEVKRSVLRVTAAQVVSAECAEQMAVAALKILGCDFAISLTGVAGPVKQEGMPVGTVFVGLADAHGHSLAERFQLTGDPDEIRHRAAAEAAARALLLLG